MDSRTLTASLEVLTVGELVSALSAARRTGRLDVVTAAGTRALYLEDGQLTGTASNIEADLLGQILWRTGKVSLDQVVIATEIAKEGKKLGRVLVEMGFLQPNDLRRALVQQGVLIFEAACVETDGTATFTLDARHPSPLRFGVATAELIHDAVRRVHDHRALLVRLGALDQPLRAASQPPHVALTEGEQAILQLVTFSKGTLSGHQLVEKSGLGRMDGMRALASLLDQGLIERRDAGGASSPALRLKRLCAAVNLVMAALDEAGFGVGDAVRDYVANPPAQFEEALSGISLDGPLDADAVLQHGRFVIGGVAAVDAALAALLFDALLQARDTLPGDVMDPLDEKVAALTQE